MGFLESSKIAAPLRGLEKLFLADKIGYGATGARNKHSKQREQIDKATNAMNDTARKQQLDLVSQAQAVAEAQTNLAMRQSVESKVAAMASKPTDQVEVSIGDPAAEAPSATRARKRKQFFNDNGYTPGVSL